LREPRRNLGNREKLFVIFLEESIVMGTLAFELLLQGQRGLYGESLLSG
jgi:hypothetical protein